MTILFYPELPTPVNKVYQLCKELGYNMTNDLGQKYNVAFWWSYDTISSGITRCILNEGCKDVSKTRVDEIFEQVFGYSTFVDPLTYKGKMVQKSDLQSIHDGKIINKPIKKRVKGQIYQRLIDNRVSDWVIRDLRIFYSDGITMVIRKHRNFNKRFKGNSIRSELIPIGKAFTKEEQEKIVEFCVEFGLDFGELDIIRDKGGKMYIIDVNNVAGRGAIRTLKIKDQIRVKQLYKQSFIIICKQTY